MITEKLSRRRFLQGIGLAATSVALAACAPPAIVPAQEAAAVPAETPEVYLWSNMIALTRPEGSDPAKYEAVQNYIMEQTGVKPVGIIPPPGNAGLEKLNLTLAAGNEQLDIFQGNWPTYRDAVQPINGYLDQYGENIRKAHTDVRWAGMTDGDGNTWGVPRLGLMGHTWYTWLRTDWMEELGLPFAKDQMTIEQLETTMAAFKERDSDAVMVTDSLNNMRGCLVGGFTEFGNVNWFDKAEGVLKPPELQPGFKDFVAKVNEWWNNGWFHPEAFSNMDFEEVVRSGKLGIHIGWYSRMTILTQRIMLEGAVPGMSVDFPDKLIGPQGLCMSNNASMVSAKMITKKSRYPDAAIQLMNWQYDPGKDNVCTAVYGIQNVDWQWADPNDKYYIDRLVKDTEGEPVYAGEFMCSTGLGTDVWYAPNDDVWRRHYLMIRDYASNNSNGKSPLDFDVPYDFNVIQDRVPGLEDISRLNAEEITKFITGVRPLSEWDDFIGQLYQAGMDNWIEAYTEQYLKVHPV